MKLHRPMGLAQTIPLRQPPRLAALVILLAGLAAYTLALPYVIDNITLILSKAGGPSNVILYAAAPAAIGAWVLTVFRTSPVAMFTGFLMLLPMTGRAPRLLGLDVLVRETFTQRLSVTTGLLLFMAAWFGLSRLRSNALEVRRVDAVGLLLLGFAVALTFSQVWHHGVMGFLLALGSSWQYLAIFVIARTLAREQGAAPYIVAAVVGALLLNALLRVMTSGLIARDASTDFLRVGGFAFGPAVGYAGYLVMGLPLALGLWRARVGPFSPTVWVVAAALLAVELLLTQTRGAIFGLAALAYLLLWRREQRWLIPAGVLSAGLFTVALATLPIFQNRRFVLDGRLLQEANVISRIELFRSHITHWFDGWGLGHGIGNQVYEFAPSVGQLLPPHNLFITLSQEAGAISATFFVATLAVVFVRIHRSQQRGSAAPLSAYLLVSLGCWMIHAALTGGSISYYYPYEGTILFFTILGAALGLTEHTRTVDAPTPARPTPLHVPRAYRRR